MKKYLLYLLIICFSNCNAKESTSKRESVRANDTTEYPIEIVKLRLQHFYDKAKWQLYCMHCDEHLNFSEFTSEKDTAVTFGMLPLKFDYLELKPDTVEIDFMFYYKNIKADRLLVRNFITYGVVFLNGSDSIRLFSGRDVKYSWARCDDPSIPCPYREVNPLQPEVIKYIKENKDKLDPWFRKEAIKRGVINE